MRPRPQALWNPTQVRAIDAFAMRELAIEGYELMQRAAHGAFRALRERWPEARHIGVVCGGGNNGGDGYVLARLARAAGFSVEIAALVEPARLTGDARRAYQDWIGAGAAGPSAASSNAAGPNAASPNAARPNAARSNVASPTTTSPAGPNAANLTSPAAVGAGRAGAIGTMLGWRDLLARPFDVLVDALLGIGVQGELRGEFAEFAAALNDQRRAVLALDVPSGLDAQTGRGALCVRADLTVTFIAGKAGLWLGAGPDVAGELIIDDLELVRWPDDLGPPVVEQWPLEEFRTRLAARARGANKGRYGHVLVIGGHVGMPGAALLSATAALRSGAGLVSVATAKAHAAVLAAARPELMIHGIDGAADAAELIARASVIAIGPGLGRDQWSRGLWEAALAAAKPLVVDADALNLLAHSPHRRDDWILTPHPGEAGRLLGTDAASIQADRLAAVAELQRRFGGSIVLKGAGTLVLDARGALALCTRGNPGMAAPGMGDVLTGITAGLYGQIDDPGAAARTAVLAHATAGDRAAAGGQRGLIATDLIDHLRACLNPL